MNYDVQTGNMIRRGISYAELITLPIGPDTFIRRGNGQWMPARDCIELTHILACHRASFPARHTPVYQTPANGYPEDVYTNVYTEDQNPDYEDYDDYDDDEYEGESGEDGYEDEEYREERIFIPTADYLRCRQKRKAAIIGVCTLGLAGLSLMGVGNTWRSNIFAGTSFSANAGMAFVLKCLSFSLLTILVAVPYFIYSVFSLIYYSIHLNNLKP